ncbi:MAG: ATP-binding protein [Lentisphaerota bacterium]|jgi:two-component system phosphate regulon sensor histidine kinase PhoR
MTRQALFRQFFGAHLLILCVAVGFLSLYTWQTGREAFHRQWVRELQTQAELAAALLPHSDGPVDETAISRFFERLGGVGDNRFTLILPDGRVVGDSAVKVARMERHDDRPEVREALAKGTGVCQRYSDTVGMQMLYLARRVPLEGPVQAVVRVSVPLHTLTRELKNTDRVLLVLLLVVLAAAAALSYGAALRVIGPVAELQRGLARLGAGDLSYRLPIPPVPHLAGLARSINQTADRLQRDILELKEERNLRTLILANMTRGVIAIDGNHRLMDLNDAARQMLNLRNPAVEGTGINEVTRDPAMLSLIDESERQPGPVEREMTAGVADEVVLNLRATALKDVAGQRIGTLVVLSDVTMLRRLERVRQDFVANVSHELRTPITSVKGFAETLLDGAMNDPATAQRFLSIIVRQATQLESIIRDLLDLARMEQSSAQTLDRPLTPVAGVLRSALELCQIRADARGVRLVLTCAEGLTVRMHAGLIEQAVVNLVDNAITYGATGAEAQVEVAAVTTGEGVRITVRDTGAGIERKHLDRIFERFYRVDKGRSRDQGGTGLGLAIVKHIVLIHNGTVAVASEPGVGSTFTILLPA